MPLLPQCAYATMPTVEVGVVAVEEGRQPVAGERMAGAPKAAPARQARALLLLLLTTVHPLFRWQRLGAVMVSREMGEGR